MVLSEAVWISLPTVGEQSGSLFLKPSKYSSISGDAVSETNSFSFGKYTFFIYFFISKKESFILQNCMIVFFPANKPSEKYS